MLSFSDFCGALSAAYATNDYSYFAFLAAKYTADPKALGYLWAIKPTKFGDVRAIRGVTGLPREPFAARYGLPVRTLAHWERGERSQAPYITQLLAYAVYSDVVSGALEAAEDKEGE